MKTNKILGLLAIIIVIVAVVLAARKPANTTPSTTTSSDTSSIAGCYVATLGRDVYTLNIDSENNGEVQGTLKYNNYQKDSSSGSFVGAYSGEMLVGYYDFQSEGMRSIRQVAFKKIDKGFVQGFGDVEVVDNRENLKDLTFDPNLTFVKGACSQ